MSLKLLKNTSLQDLYLEDNQTIWFLIWILKKAGPCDRYISQMILETPFQVIQKTYENGDSKQYIQKNGQEHGQEHGLACAWYDDGQLWYEKYWKNGQQHGLARGWYESGQLWREENWKNGQRNGLARGWYRNGQLAYENHWENGLRIE